MKHIKKLLLNGNEVTAVNKLIDEGPPEPLPDNDKLAGYQVAFDNLFHMHVEAVVVGDAGAISTHLFTGNNERVAHINMIPGGIDQDFQLEYEGSIYRLTIERKAAPVLTDQIADSYVDLGGCRCPHCDSDEITPSNMQTDTSMAWQRVACDACGAEWRDNYRLVSVESIVAPTQNME